MKPLSILCSIVVLVSLLLIGCGRQASATPLPVLPSAISTPVSTPLWTRSPTNPPTQTPTLTTVPTLSKQDALETFTNLIETDGTCDLPCWLGITPGQTRFEEVKNAFSRFSTIATINFLPSYASIRVFFPNLDIAIHDTKTEVYPAGDRKVSKVWVYAGIDPRGIHKNITLRNPEFHKMWQRYFIPEIFTKYGPPGKIFLDTTRLTVDPATSYPFVLWIVYPQQGFLVRYQGNNSSAGQNLRICPMQSKIQIKIWDPEEASYEDFTKDDAVLASPFGLGPQPIEEVTEFTITSFHEAFKSGKTDTCFETPASLWPPNK